MNAPHRTRTPTTAQRLAALEQISESVASGTTLLWLMDASWGTPRLLPSYISGGNETTSELLTDLEIPIETKDLEDLNSKKIPEELELSIRVQLEEVGIDPDSMNIYPLNLETEIRHSGKNIVKTAFLGILGHDGAPNEIDTKDFSRDLRNLCHQIEISRLQRYAHAVTTTQELLHSIETNVDQSLIQIGHIVKSEVGARRFIYKNDNTGADWTEIIEANGELERIVHV